MKILVKPRAGLRLRDPATGRTVPPEGAWVTEDNFWRRRIRDGDVTVAEPTPATDAHGGS